MSVCVHIGRCIYLDHSDYENPVSVWRYEMRALGWKDKKLFRKIFGFLLLVKLSFFEGRVC